MNFRLNLKQPLAIAAVVTLLAGCAVSPSQTYRTPELTKASALNNEGYDRMAVNDPSGARPYFDKALAQEPDLAIAHLNKGAVYQNTGDSTSAIKEYRLAIANDTPANDYPLVTVTTDGRQGTVSDVANRNLESIRTSSSGGQ